MKWINPLKNFFSLFGQFWLRKFSCQSLRWWWWGCQKSHLNQKCRKFHEMDKCTKKIFFTVWPIFSSEFEVFWGSYHIKCASNLFNKAQFHQVIKMRDNNPYQLQILTLSLISLSYHFQHSSNLYNKAQFHQAIKMRGDNPILTTNPNTSLHIFVISYQTFFKPL